MNFALSLFPFPVELHINLNPLSHYYIKFSLLDPWTFPVKPMIFCKIYGGGQKGLPSQKTCHRYPTIIKLGTVIPYLKKIQKIYESCVKHPMSSADISISSLEITKFWYIKKCRYRLHVHS